MITFYRKSISLFGMLMIGVITSLVRYLSFGYLIKLNRKFIAPGFAWCILTLLGMKVRSDIDRSRTETCIYFFNHNSFLDLFLVPYISLENTRFIITEGVKSILPLHLCNLGIDVLYIPDTHKTEERIQFFKRVSKDLSEGKYSVICSPEGRHPFINGIAPFNKGVFHMAFASKRPIHQLFFDIKTSGSPDAIKNIITGVIHIKTIEIVATESWKEDELPVHMNSMRKEFLSYYYKANGDYGESKLEA